MPAYRKLRLGLSTAVLALVLVGCGSTATTPSGGGGSPSTGKVTLTLWQNLGNGTEAQVVPPLIAAFEKLHPNIHVVNVAQPRASYFALLQAAAVSRTGPDLLNMWTGLFTIQDKSYLENLKAWVPASDLSRMNGLQWSSVGFNSPSSPYVIPLQVQDYIGFYNKALFQQVGITAPPTDWSQLFSDCAKLTAAHITCMEEGTQNLSGEFYPWYDLSYLMAGVLSPSQWEGLYNGRVPWTSPAVVAQLSKWHQLYTDGYINHDALTATNVQGAFLQGKAAMIIKGNWDTAQFSATLGKNVGVFAAPFSNAPMHKVVEFAGNGFAMTSYSPHKAAAAQFLQFMTTPQAARIVASQGLIPAVNGVGATNALANQMVALVTKQHYTMY
ncbi:MAG: ABC transporter substrate-binding protein, partial [Candidatus Dormibacteria bacterium]